MSFDKQSLAEKAGAQPPAAGDAGSNFLNNLFPPDITNKSQVIAFNQGAHDLKDLAGKGGFAINEAGMTEYIKLCNMFEDGFNSMDSSLYLLTELAKLGSSLYAYQVASHNVTAVNGDKHSLIPNLEPLRDGYRQHRKETEAEHDKVFRKINAE